MGLIPQQSGRLKISVRPDLLHLLICQFRCTASRFPVFISIRELSSSPFLSNAAKRFPFRCLYPTYYQVLNPSLIHRLHINGAPPSTLVSDLPYEAVLQQLLYPLLYIPLPKTPTHPPPAPHYKYERSLFKILPHPYIPRPPPVRIFCNDREAGLSAPHRFRSSVFSLQIHPSSARYSIPHLFPSSHILPPCYTRPGKNFNGHGEQGVFLCTPDHSIYRNFIHPLHKSYQRINRFLFTSCPVHMLTRSLSKSFQREW